MTVFVVGKVLEPETRVTVKGKTYVNFGLLVGKSSEEFSLWDDSKSYPFALRLRDGEPVIAICNSIVNDKGQLRTYVNDIAPAPEGLRETLLKLFKDEPQGVPSSSRENAMNIPEPAAAKK